MAKLKNQYTEDNVSVTEHEKGKRKMAEKAVVKAMKSAAKGKPAKKSTLDKVADKLSSVGKKFTDAGEKINKKAFKVKRMYDRATGDTGINGPEDAMKGSSAQGNKARRRVKAEAKQWGLSDKDAADVARSAQIREAADARRAKEKQKKSYPTF